MNKLLLGVAFLAVGSAQAADVTFAGDVAAIVYEHCAVCHRDGASAPFTLTSYDDVRKRGRLIQAVTAGGYMPPWHAEEGWGEFENERRLTNAEIGIIARWIATGMAEGDPAETPEPPQFASGWELGEPDLVVEMEQEYTVPAEGADIYRNFVAAIGNTEDKWIRAIEFRPGARAVMHHSLFKADTSGKARELDAKDEEPGYAWMGGGAVRGLINLSGWAVGGNARVFPEESPLKLPANSDFVFESHFHPSGKEETERSAVAFYFAEKPASRPNLTIQLPPLFGAGAGLDIPAGESEFWVRESFTLPAAVELYSVTPHAHYIGKDFRAWAELPDGSEVKLIRVPDWDFAWQNMYVYAAPIELPKGTTIRAEVRYDNSAENPRNPHSPPERVTWGEASDQEMAAITFNALPVENADAPLINQTFKELRDRHLEKAKEQRRNRKQTVQSGTSED